MELKDIPVDVRSALYSRGFAEADILKMSPFSMFHNFCEWEGLINWSDTLWNTVQQLEQLK